MRKPVYNDRYYKIQALLKNDAFQADIAWLKDQFAKYDVPIPDDGFDKYSEYLSWNDSFWDVWSKCEHSEEVKTLWEKYANPKDGKIYTIETMDQYEAEKAELVPPVYGHYLRQVAVQYGFDFKDEDFHEFLIHYVFLGKNEITDPSFVVNHRRNQKTNEAEMYVRIFPWTTKDDIVSGWHFIREEQAYYRKGEDRNQVWKNFDRDHRIYQLSEEAKEMRAGGDKRRVEEITHSLYLTETKDGDMDLANIKRIIHNVRKRLGLENELSDDNS